MIMRVFSRAHGPLLPHRPVFGAASRESKRGGASKSVKEGDSIKVSKLKFKEEQGGYKIYESSMEKSFMKMSIGLTISMALSGCITYIDVSFGNVVSCCLIAAINIYYQRQLMKTAKDIMVDKTGTKIRLRAYGLFGTYFQGQFIEIPIHVLNGYKVFYGRGVRILGGGNYGYKPFHYNFSPGAILDERTFRAVAKGNFITYADIL